MVSTLLQHMSQRESSSQPVGDVVRTNHDDPIDSRKHKPNNDFENNCNIGSGHTRHVIRTYAKTAQFQIVHNSRWSDMFFWWCLALIRPSFLDCASSFLQQLLIQHDPTTENAPGCRMWALLLANTTLQKSGAQDMRMGQSSRAKRFFPRQWAPK